MSDGTQSSEKGTFRDLLEVSLTDVQHGGTEIKLLEELSDENVNADKIVDVLVFNITNNIS